MIVEPTHAQGEAKLIAQKYAAQYGSDCVIVSCGGDGTVHEIANGLANTDTPLLLLPLSTDNDFAKKVYGTKKINVENVIKAFGFYSGKIGVAAHARNRHQKKRQHPIPNRNSIFAFLCACHEKRPFPIRA